MLCAVFFLYFNSVTKTKVKIYAKIGAIPQTVKNRFTVLLLKVFLNPFLLILKAIKAAPFNCTNEVGIPFVTEANKSKLATIIAITVALNGDTSTISFPVFLVTLCPSKELPMAKQGATIKTDRIIIGRKF